MERRGRLVKSVEQMIRDWEESPELQCNNCGVVFKGSHECSYEKLKEDNKRLKSVLSFYANEENYKRPYDDLLRYLPSELDFDNGENARKALENLK